MDIKINYEDLILLISPKPPKSGGYRLRMNRITQFELRKVRDGDGNFVWQPAAVVGHPATAFGYPIAEDDGLSDNIIRFEATQ